MSTWWIKVNQKIFVKVPLLLPLALLNNKSCKNWFARQQPVQGCCFLSIFLKDLFLSFRVVLGLVFFTLPSLLGIILSFLRTLSGRV